MRILQINAVPGSNAAQAGGIYGGERSVTLLCRGLIERGHDLQLALSSHAPMVELARGEHVPIAEMRGRNPRSLPVVLELARLARRHKAQLLAAHGSRASRLTILAGKLTRTPVVSTMRGLYRAKSYRNAHRIIAVSEGVRQHILAQGVAPEQVVTVHNGADVSRFSPPQDKSAAKRAVGLEENAIVIGVVARLSAEKGHDWFFNAVAPLSRESPHARFLLVGDGPLHDEIASQVRQLGAERQTVFAGYQADIVPWMAAMDVLVLPSVSQEGFARSLIEAGAMGVPAIASPVGGNGEAVLDGETGWLVPTNDVEALRSATRRALNDQEERERFGVAMRERVRANFTVERMVENTEAVYRDALARAGRAAT